jgi:hypothetical protein
MRNRYPNHADPSKGQTRGGECNRTDCARERADWWNPHTFGYYCGLCASEINIGLTQNNLQPCTKDHPNDQ